MNSPEPAEYSVRVRNLVKSFELSPKNQNFKEFIKDGLSGLFTDESSNGIGKFYALKNVSFELDKGDVLGIIGDNGAGKSTLLKIISGVSQPSDGEVAINGKISSILEIGTGFHMELTGKENVYLSGSILGMSHDEIKRQYSNIVGFSGLGDFIHVPIKRYSSGMYLRLAFSVLAHLSNDIILLDEIIYVGDAEFKIKSYNKIKELAGSGKTILIVSHDLTSIADLCNKCLLLEKGEVRLAGKTNEIVSKYIDKSLLKYINSAHEDQSRKLQEEMENLQVKIRKMEQNIREKDERLHSSVEKELSLVSEISKLKEDTEELNRIKGIIEVNSEGISDLQDIKPEKTWDNEQSAPGNESVRLKRVFVTTPDNKGSFGQADDLILGIEYWKYVPEPIVIGLTASYNFSRTAFGAASALGESEELKNYGEGLFKNFCMINKYVLNQGVFSFSIFFLNANGALVYSIPDVIFIKINPLSSVYEKFDYKGNLSAPFVLGLKWW